MIAPGSRSPLADRGSGDVAELADRVRRADARLGAVRLVALDGPSGSGKSVLADELVARLGELGEPVALVRTDDFATWDEPVQWWPRLVDGVLDPLARGRPGGYRRVEWVDGSPVPGAQVRVPVPGVLVLEGVSSGRRSMVGTASLVVWVEQPDRELRLRRAVARDGELIRPHVPGWQRFEDDWFAADGTRSRADVRLIR